MLRFRPSFFAAALVLTSASFAQELDFSKLDMSMPSFDGLSNYSLPSGPTPKTPECEQYLRLNVTFNPDQYLSHCVDSSLTIQDLERVRSAMRSQKGSCAAVANLKVEDYRQRHTFDQMSGTPSYQNNGPSGEFGIQWTMTLGGGNGAGRQRLRLRTPIGSASKTLVDGQRVTSRLPHRRERHQLIEDARTIRHDLKDDARSFNLDGIGSNFSGENLATYGAYEIARKASREARSGSSHWERQAQDAFIDQGDCERYWNTQISGVMAKLGARR